MFGFRSHSFTSRHTHEQTWTAGDWSVATQTETQVTSSVMWVCVSSLTDTRPHVHGRHEAVVTQTAVFSGDVGALTSIADLRCLLTLVDI